MSKTSFELPTLEAPQRDGAAVQSEWEEYLKELLSVADSCVLNYSLVTSRQRHIQQLFPHLITHPPVPSHQRSRQKTRRPASLLEPPPPPDWPLPVLEYHDPAKPLEKKEKKDKKKKKGETVDEDATASKRVSVPAHETDCIARVTLTVGPFTYPDTELWVGRFVDAKTYVKPRQGRTFRPQDEAKPATTTQTVRPSFRAPPVIPPRPTPGNSFAGPSTRPAPRPATHPPQFRPGSSAPVSEELITAVNAIAARHPRLKDVISRASKHQATTEELATLGRVVSKLSHNEPITAADIGVSAPAGSFGARPSVSSSRPSLGFRPAASAIAGRATMRPVHANMAPRPPGQPSLRTAPDASPAAQHVSVPETKPTLAGLGAASGPKIHQAADDKNSDSSLSDDEPDMTGPSQVGGGPLDAAPKDPPSNILPSSAPPSALLAQRKPEAVRSTTPIDSPRMEPRAAIPEPPALPTSLYRPTARQGPTPSSSSLPGPAMQPYSIGRPSPANTPATHTPGIFRPMGRPSYPSLGHATGPPTYGTFRPYIAPVTPAPLLPLHYPPVPRFLLLAFKDAPTEKFQIPLGLNSYISRKGGDHATSSAPLCSPAPRSPPLVKGAAPTPVSQVEPVDKATDLGTTRGAVTISFFTTNNWQEMDWDAVAQALPWAETKSEAPVPNIGSVDLLPSDRPLQPISIKVEGLDDLAWRRMQSVMREVELAEMDKLKVERIEYQNRRKFRFESLLSRVAPRRFLQTRTSIADPAIVETLTDKWALRPYQISNKAHSQEEYEAVASPPRKRKAVESAVTFEMPVSFDALDEHLEEGAHLIGRKSKAGRPRGRGRGRVPMEGATKRAKVHREKKPCEGCGREDRNVWRRGPGGSNTLCNDCGDAYLAGTLGEEASRVAMPSAQENVEASEIKAEDGDAMQGVNVEAIEP